jgi:hypothetical protein
MLKFTGASVKIKAAFAVAALLCVITPCLTISCSHPYTCTLEDINKSSKVSGDLLHNIVYLNNSIVYLNKSLSDGINLKLWCDREFSEAEIKNLEQFGIYIYDNGASWIPSSPPNVMLPLYYADCKVEDICRLISIGKVKEISIGHAHAQPLDNP